MKSKEGGADKFKDMTNYALEIQAIAQAKDCAIIDLSQISNEGLNDSNADFGFIPYKYSGDLYSSTDVGILLKCPRTPDHEKAMEIYVRKHKYASSASIECKFIPAEGHFSAFGESAIENTRILTNTP